MKGMDCMLISKSNFTHCLTGKVCFVQSFMQFCATMDASDMLSSRLSGDPSFVVSLTAKVANLKLGITPGTLSNDICLSAACVDRYVWADCLKV